jgi:23S rRNA (cytidine2498-2'-O)-methyltransferase
MAKSLINSDLIERLQVDGYVYRSCKEVEWMMCDTVEGLACTAALC